MTQATGQHFAQEGDDSKADDGTGGWGDQNSFPNDNIAFSSPSMRGSRGSVNYRGGRYLPRRPESRRLAPTVPVPPPRQFYVHGVVDDEEDDDDDDDDEGQNVPFHKLMTLKPGATVPAVLPLTGGPGLGARRRMPFDQPLDEKFKTVEKPKRFFSIGRVFKTVWFEPYGHPPTSRGALVDAYTQVCPEFHSEKPYAKFRWFVVVRKRLHHSLCFSITTFTGGSSYSSSSAAGGGGGGNSSTAAKPLSRSGRSRDFVVLYKIGEEAPAPRADEDIVREPLGLIVEDGDQDISSLARLDCGRVYTVEDNLRVMKIGRVHPEHLGRLEAYYKEAVQ